MSHLKKASYRNSLIFKGSNIPFNCTLLQSPFAILGTNLLLYVKFPLVYPCKLLPLKKNELEIEGIENFIPF